MAFHHHEKRTMMVNLFTIPMFIAVLAVLTFFNKPIRRVVNIPKQMVQGTSDVRSQDLSKEAFTKELASDTKEQVEEIKEGVLDTTIRDIVNFLGRGGKVIKDVDSLQHQGLDYINSIDPFKK